MIMPFIPVGEEKGWAAENTLGKKEEDFKEESHVCVRGANWTRQVGDLKTQNLPTMCPSHYRQN